MLSNRADLVSGGDALVAVQLGAGTDPATVRVILNGADITGAFALRSNGQYAGLVTGLVEGENLLRARMPDGSGGPGGAPLGDAPASALIPASTRLMEQAGLVGGAVGGSYANQLSSVQAYLAQGDISSACGALRGYSNHVRAQSGKKLPAALASQLMRNADSIGEQIGCTA